MTAPNVKLPSLGVVDSLRFVHDVPGFLERGRRLGPVWRFWFPGTPGRRMTVVGDHDLALGVLGDRTLEPYHGELLAPWLGDAAPLIVSGSALAEARACAKESMHRVDPQGVLRTACRAAVGAEGRRNFADVLRECAVEWSQAMIVGEDLPPELCREVREAIGGWLAAADSPALVVPALRRRSPLTLAWPTARRWAAAWAGLPAARARLVRALIKADDRLGRMSRTMQALVTDARITMFAGAIDNPSMLAGEALAGLVPGETPAAAVDRALRSPPAPLVFRSAPRGYAVAGLKLRPGDGIAVDLAAARMPFGSGDHGCLGARAAWEFAVVAVEEAIAAGLRPVGPPVRGRVHLSWGVTHLQMAA